MVAAHSHPSAAAGAAVLDRPTTETWGERVYASLPLFIVGAAFLAVTLDLYFSGASPGVGRNGGIDLEPWALFLALAITGLAAGTFALLIEDDESSTVATPPPTSVPESPPVEVAEWDESTLEPEEAVPVRPRIWERYPDVSPTAASATDGRDPVLDQIDEIQDSLRRKTGPSRST
jgi:hypothetical protein